MKRCPHCGGKARFVRLWSEHLKDLVSGRTPIVHKGCVRCESCKARSATDTKHEAVQLWNRRAS